jgi:pilus assembly protein CpaC
VRPEVTEPDDSRAITAAGIQVTAFSQRYVETAVEMQAGQTFAIAGLLQSRTESVTRATPIIGEIPLVGMLFRRVREERNDIELLITVTPEIVDAMNPHEVPTGGPGLNSTSPCDTELYVHGHIEVPNLLGNDMNCMGGQGDGYSTLNGLAEGTPYTEGPGYAETASPYDPSAMPSDIVIPTEQPIVVGEGVTVTAPTE